MATTNIILAITLAFGCCLHIADMAYLDVNNFFNVRGNLTKVTWAHAVNNQSLLSNALNSSTVMMLEADVVIGIQTGDPTQTLRPIMAHPPANNSDLTLEKFISQVNSFNNNPGNFIRKGVKLDFKTIQALEQSVSLLKYMYNNMTYPVWINADIISGPVNSQTTPVDPIRFFNATRAFENSTLSIGWTTNYGVDVKNATYTDDQISNMLTTIQKNNVTQSITFPVRAGIAAESLSQMTKLIKSVSKSTLTVWSSDKDPVNVARLRTLILEVGVGKVYIDVPKSLEEQLGLGGAGVLAPLMSVLSVMLVLSYIF